MLTNHYKFWPRIPTSLTLPQTSLYDNLSVTTKRYPDKTALIFYGTTITYKALHDEVIALAGFLQQAFEVQKGEKVLLFMQNSPQFIAAYYAINRADAVVVPINPMLTASELEFYIKDCEIQTAIIGQELYDQVAPLLQSTTLNNLVIAAYSDYLTANEVILLPKEVAEPRKSFGGNQHVYWQDAIAANYVPTAHTVDANSLAVIPYTSGTTGLPKGCMHPNKTVQANILGSFHFSRPTPNTVHLMTLPLFHVTGMVQSMHTPIYTGSTIVIMTRWDREHALEFIRMYKCTHWVTISTMLVDFLSNPNLRAEDVASFLSISGGGATLPEAIGQKLLELTGIRFVEGYGLSETIAQTHVNPPDRPKLQCLGVPTFDVDSRIIDPATGKELGANEVGEIVTHGPQIMTGYYNREEENKHAFIELDGKSFFRTGDIGRYDEEGYFFIVDRVKRMINASGYKVWPTEIESFLYKHPAVKQACVVGVPDARRGETVKAFVILQDEYVGRISEGEIKQWAKEHMAAYKYPRIIEFKQSFPTTSSGKILWRKLQEEELSKLENA